MNWYSDFESIVKKDVSLAPLTWFGLGGPAKYLIEPRDAQELSAVVRRLHKENIPLYVLGGGANLLVNDQGVDGAVIRLTAPAFTRVEIVGTQVRVGGGMDVQKLLLQLVKAGLGGLECLAGIPGTVGGELRMNAGGAYGDIGSCVLDITVMDSAGNIHIRRRDDLVFEYRKSNINATFILEATFELEPGNPERLATRMKEIWMYKKSTQPLRDNSAGCIFRNFNGKSAGAIIDQAGLKGLSVGGAQISTQHANFIVAEKGAKAADVLALIDLVKAKVLQKSNIQLETEVVVW